MNIEPTLSSQQTIGCWQAIGEGVCSFIQSIQDAALRALNWLGECLNSLIEWVFPAKIIQLPDALVPNQDPIKEVKNAIEPTKKRPHFKRQANNTLHASIINVKASDRLVQIRLNNHNHLDVSILKPSNVRELKNVNLRQNYKKFDSLDLIMANPAKVIRKKIQVEHPKNDAVIEPVVNQPAQPQAPVQNEQPKLNVSQLPQKGLSLLLEQGRILLEGIVCCPQMPISALDAEMIIKYCADVLAKKPDITDEEKKQLKTFFFEVADFNKEEIFSPWAIKGKMDLQLLLSEFLNEYLTHPCQPLHELVKEQKANPALANDKDHQLNIQLAKAKLAMKLGVQPVPTGEGANGAVFLDDPFEPSNNTHIAVFKAPVEYAWNFGGLYNWTMKTGKSYVGQARLLHHAYIDTGNTVHSEQFAEVAAYQLSKQFGLNVAPAAVWTSMESRNDERMDGAFIYFLRGFTPLNKRICALKDRLKADAITKEEQDKIALASAAQFAFGNLDPTLNDFFVRFADGNQVQEIVAIDFGNAFKIYNGVTNNEGTYRKIPSAKIPFSDEVKQQIQNNFTDENITKWKMQLEQQGYGAFVTKEKEEQLRLRCKMLREGLSQGLKQFISPASMAAVKSDQDYAAVVEQLAKV